MPVCIKTMSKLVLGIALLIVCFDCQDMLLVFILLKYLLSFVLLLYVAMQ